MDEFYHKNIFGDVVDVNLQEEEDSPPLDKKGKEFDIFRFINVFGRRNKKESWILYQEAILAGVAPDRIFFTLMWKVKSMLLSKKTPELLKLSENLVIGYHMARRGEGEVETLIEKTLLSL